MSTPEERIEALLGEMRKVNERLETADDGGRKAAAIDGQAEIAADLTKVDEERELTGLKAKRLETLEAQVEQMARLMHDTRTESKAGIVGGSQPAARGPVGLRPRSAVKASSFMQAAFEDGYEGGTFFNALLNARGIGYDGHLDPSLMGVGKASLASLGTEYFEGLPEKSTAGQGIFDAKASFNQDGSVNKATLGTTGAAGGFVLPNNLVDRVLKPATQKAVLQQLVTVINGVSVRGVDQPYRTGAPSRATFQDWGTTKTNVNLAYGTYSAYLGTIAVIYDIGKQYARFSAGAAEQDVMDEVTRGIILGENYYMIAGAGTGTGGYSGDPTTGVYTALNSGSNTYKTAFSGASNSTLAGSFAVALTQASSALASRSRESQAWVVDSITFWTAIAQGTDTAGFWVDPSGGPTGFTRTASGALSYWGVPVYYDANLNTETGTTKIAIGGEWDQLKLYRGMELRIDTSDQAGTRWDQNLIGFRGEEELGFNASSAVSVGALQLITSTIP